MENNGNQGHYQRSELQWVCPDCETVNTGDNCAVCGCPRPDEKQEPEIPQTLGEQGSYEDAFPEWICPGCETRNVGKICTVCGCSRPEKKKPISKKILVAAVVAVVIVISALAGITVRLPDYLYQNACALLESGQYEQAYPKFIVLGNYQHSEQYASQAADKWIQRTLDKHDVTQAALIRNIVKLSPSQAENLYQELYTRDIYTYDSADGLSDSYDVDDLSVRRILLEMLSSGPYIDKEKLNTLLKELDVRWPVTFVQEHRDILEDLWYMPVVQNIVRNDLCIKEWLLGTWRTENGSHYLKFYQNDSVEIYSQYTVPWGTVPEGTDYYDIQNLTFVFLDEDMNVLAEIYRFKLLEPDKIEVYAYKNEKTYTLVRK